MRLVLVALAAAFVSATAASADVTVRATLATSSTTAVVGVPWRYRIAVHTQAGDPLSARARLQVLHGSQLVGCWTRSGFVRCRSDDAGSRMAFKGARSATILWPARWVGVDLTFRAVVVTGMQTLRLRAPVIVRAVERPAQRPRQDAMSKRSSTRSSTFAAMRSPAGRSKWTPSSARILTSFPEGSSTYCA
jgi:hypothetical protein